MPNLKIIIILFIYKYKIKYMKKKIRVRFAPSPTGALHIGGIRTALYNYLYAIKNNGKLILRIEDTDIKRNIKYSLNYIIKSLKWLKIKYNEGYLKNGLYKPYIQSKRLKIYKKFLNILIKKKLVYYSFETKNELYKYKKKNKKFLYNSLNRKKLKNSLSLSKKKIKKFIKNRQYVIRIKTPKNKNIKIIDKVYGKIIINTNKLDDKILFRSNLTPTYHFSNVIDDHIMKISHIIRGKEWISSTPIHILIYNYFNWKLPKFIHLPLLLSNKGKISKRYKYNNNNNNINTIFPINSKKLNINNSYKSNGFLPEALINIIALLGWNPNKNKEILNLNNLIKLFNFNNINKNNIHLNYKKFCWINKQYIKKKKYNKLLFKYIKKKLKKNNIINIKNKKIKKIIILTKNRISLINEIWDVTKYFFINPKKYYIPKNINLFIKKNFKKVKIFLKKIKNYLFKKKSKKKINKLLKKIKINENLKILRILIVGKLIGISLLNILYLINNKVIIYRINKFKNKIICQYKIY
ncbi:MAG: glutamate--tRNA ligase [Candidatus Shikimatogenerans sp. JK-2022]|nr:glutamate--tRNA ligase [Candidatus Shikimatogenerans bostrichidophilus]